jgi:hypothetical protein
MGELIYIVEAKGSIETIEPLEISVLLFISFYLFFIKEKIQYTKIFFMIFFSFIVLNISVNYYISSKLSTIIEQALIGNKYTEKIEGLVTKYQYTDVHKREQFMINDIHFLIENNHKVFFENYLKALKNKKLKLKIEYLKYPKFNTTVVRIWKLP